MGSDTGACRIASCGAGGIEVILDNSVYDVEAIKKAAYKFGDRFHILIEPISGGKTKALLKAIIPLSDADRDAGEFCNEVLDQDLRARVASETEAIRNLLLAHAFSKVALLDPELETEDYHADPRGILLRRRSDCTST